MSLRESRRDYNRLSLTEGELERDPIRQFQRWFEEATLSEIPEPNAMALATATPDGCPSVRIVLLRGYDNRGFVFFTNYESRKGRELEANPRAALVFYWHDLERQVRVEGPVERTSVEESDVYFQSRPAGSKLGAWASRQSEVIADRTDPRRPRSRAPGAVWRRPDSPPRMLGRIPSRPHGHRVLARPTEPAARPAAVYPKRKRLAHRAAVAVIASEFFLALASRCTQIAETQCLPQVVQIGSDFSKLARSEPALAVSIILTANPYCN